MVVGQALGAAPGAGAVGFAVGELPTTVGFKLMVSHTQRTKISHITPPTLIPRGCVINVAAGRGGIAAWEAAAAIAGDDQSA